MGCYAPRRLLSDGLGVGSKLSGVGWREEVFLVPPLKHDVAQTCQQLSCQENFKIAIPNFSSKHEHEIHAKLKRVPYLQDGIQYKHS